MIKALIILCTFYSSVFCAAQDIPAGTKQQLENFTDARQADITDDSYLQQLDYFKRHPVNLNTADANDIRELIFLSDLQIDNFISYRKLLGKLISIYELQAIPSFDLATIKKILPYVTISDATLSIDDLAKRFRKGDQSLIVRFSEVLEKSKGFHQTASGTPYLGNRDRIFFRYRYQYKNLLQYGILGDKDAGEQFFRGAEKYGFDFYSFHFFMRRIGKIQALALGDFTANMGQGLIQWQGLAFSKSAEVMNVKRQSAILRPYTSAGEFYFNRGAAVTLQFGKIEVTAFSSVRKLSSNFVADTGSREDFISSFQISGYHRTASEIADRNNLSQFSAGGNVTYRKKNWHVGINGVAYHFSLPIVKRPDPYNYFAVTGKQWSNFSFDYSYTLRNLHVFGEAASDKNLDKAFLNGVLISIGPKVDLSFVQRTIDKKYQALYGDAFTESTLPSNENGIYSGISLRPVPGWCIDMYADFYRFPWLRYLADAPSDGKDFLVQVSFSPNKQVEISSRFRNEAKQSNERGNNTPTNYLVLIPKQDWRTEISYQISLPVTIVQRTEVLWYDHKRSKNNGFLSFLDFRYRPSGKPFSANIRLQYFETGDYDSRIYAYESDLLYNFSIPAVYGKGYRYYVNMNFDASRRLSLWVRWSQTIYKDQTSIGTGLDQIPKNHKSEAEAEARWLF